MQLVLATHNAHKVEELRRILGPRLGDIELLAYNGPEPVEDGDTFEANALIKARAAFAHTGIPSIADDSGISVDALDGAPGIYSARYAGTRSDTDNLRLLLTNMRGIENRTAHFTCAAALVDGDVEHTEVGIWPGSVLTEPHGENGFGYDPIFRPKGSTISSAEYTSERKNAESHRALAFAKLLDYVHARYGTH